MAVSSDNLDDIALLMPSADDSSVIGAVIAMSIIIGNVVGIMMAMVIL